MPYEYRKLSPKERGEIVRYRSERGYPLHAPPHPFRGAGAYLISAANFEHKPVMKSSVRRTEFETRLLNTLQEIANDLVAFIQSLDRVSAALKHLHGSTSREWNIEDGLVGKRRVWYKFADTYIRNEVHLHVAVNYIHYNPVKHGYVSDPYDCCWSSLSLYYEDKGRNGLREHWKLYTPPPDFGNGWDNEVENNYTCPGGRCQGSRYYRIEGVNHA